MLLLSRLSVALTFLSIFVFCDAVSITRNKAKAVAEARKKETRRLLYRHALTGEIVDADMLSPLERDHLVEVDCFRSADEEPQEITCYICGGEQEAFTSLQAAYQHVHEAHLPSDSVLMPEELPLQHPCGEPACSRAFTTPYKRDKHQAQHVENKPYECLERDCPSWFTEAHIFTRHKKLSHGPSENVECPKCYKPFTSREYLRGHLKSCSSEDLIPVAVEDGEFGCSICPDRFHDRSDMRQHFKTHKAEEKPYPCLHCALAYTRSQNLYRHVRGAHPNV